VVLDLERWERHRLLHLAAPERIVIDVFGRRRAGARAGAGAAARGPLTSMELRPLRVVVVDPGHGGRDPGAIGVGGLREKDVTLRARARARAASCARAASRW
jgi:N-acetylmuramoyl-L-alanine amidase